MKKIACEFIGQMLSAFAVLLGALIAVGVFLFIMMKIVQGML